MKFVKQEMSKNVLNGIYKSVTTDILDDLICCVFNDGHPLDQNPVDITVCRSTGDVIEYHKRYKVSSISLGNKLPPKETDIMTFRNTKSQLFYLVHYGENVIILSRDKGLEVKIKLENVVLIDIADRNCSGVPVVKIKTKVDALPLIFNDNMEVSTYEVMSTRKLESSKYSHLDSALAVKENAIRHCLQHNNKSYETMKRLRCETTKVAIQNLFPKPKDPYQYSLKNLAKYGGMKVDEPWIRVYQDKLIVIICFCNQNAMPIKQIQLLFTNLMKDTAVSYKSNVYKVAHYPPFWSQASYQLIKFNEPTTTLVSVVKLKDLMDQYSYKLSLNSLISYKILKKQKDKPDVVSVERVFEIKPINMLMSDAMKPELSLLNGDIDHVTILGLMAVTQKTELVLRHIRQFEEPFLQLAEALQKYLGMEEVCNSPNTLVYRKSPLHMLYGVMVIVEVFELRYLLTVFARDNDQVLSFIHFMSDSLPHTIIVTPKQYGIAAKQEAMAHYTEQLIRKIPKPDLRGTLKQVWQIMEKLDEYLVRVRDRSPLPHTALSSFVVDLFGLGAKEYMVFKKDINNELWTCAHLFTPKGESQLKLGETPTPNPSPMKTGSTPAQDTKDEEGEEYIEVEIDPMGVPGPSRMFTK